MGADLPISVKDLNRRKHLKVLPRRLPSGPRPFWVRTNGERWPQSGWLVSLTSARAALRSAQVSSKA
jgi:hypothetical protein